MKIATMADVKVHLSEYLEECEREPVVVTKRGRMKAVLLPVGDEEDLERLLLSQHPTFRAIIDESERSLREKGGISHERFWQMAGEDEADDLSEGKTEKAKKEKPPSD